MGKNPTEYNLSKLKLEWIYFCNMNFSAAKLQQENKIKYS